MKVLVIGGGGREHAIVDALSRSPQVEKIFCAPGNAGITAQAECVAIRETEVERLRDFAAQNGIGLTVVGPEVALAAGVVDVFKAAGLRAFGPTKAAARIESSKEFAKDLMAKYAIPTAGYRAFTDYAAAMDYVASRPLPAVLKYDGLAAGKGVVIAETMEEADAALPFITAEDERYALEKVLQPTADAMVAEGCPFEGVLYGGLMKTPQGIKVIEFNARFGDPETEVVLPRLKSDIVDIFCAVADGGDTQLVWHDFATLGIVLASKGYPGAYEKGCEIKGLDRVEGALYHMGTKADGSRILTSGGRVLFVVGKGATLAEARANALRDVARIGCDNLFHRTDIGHWAFEN